jgi:crotonobetainyl-CoA:carnitine CoA-transferase CaiB-like acyl-CoA transferase
MTTDADGLLAGVRILDLTIWRPGPYATQLLAEIGAEVIKVEPPGGDPMRVYPGIFATLHANKRSVVLDLKAEPDRERALTLADGADVVIEGYRPGVADRLGIGYEAVRARNPAVIYCSVSGYGQTGPLEQVPGHDVNYTAWSGALRPDGGPPSIPAVPIADLAGGMAAAFAISAALVRQRDTGEGERIDVAMTDVLTTWTGVVRPVAAGVDGTVDDPEDDADDRRSSGRSGVPGYGTYETAGGGFVSLGIISEPHFWRGLCDALGLGDVADLDFATRTRRGDELQARIRDAVRRQPRDELVATLLASGVPVAPVLDRDEVGASRELRQRGVITRDPWSEADDVVAGYPIRLVHHPAQRRTPSPAPGAHPDATWRPRPADESR